MKKYSLNVKNLTCDNYNRMQQLKEQLEKNNVHVKNIIPGKIILADKPHPFQLKRIQVVLINNKMKLIVDKKQMITEEIKSLIRNLFNNNQNKELLYMNYTDYIAKNIGKNYNNLSNLFSKTENITINKFIVSEKIMRIKELLNYGDLDLKEIAYQVGYNSVHYLSYIFKKETGMTITHFRKINKTNTPRSLKHT